MIELTATTPDWTGALDEARRAWPDVIVGVGTLRSEAEAEQAVAAGARFLVSPGPHPACGPPPSARAAVPGGRLHAGRAGGRDRARSREAVPRARRGAGLPGSLLAVLPGAMVVPTGGIQPDEVDAYLEAGALAVGINADRLADPPPG